jgi:hypothetical protein
MNVMSDTYVPMRDGVRLATDIMLPDGNEPFSVILTRTPYGKNRFSVKSPETYVQAGYAFAAQDCRGRYRSEGEWFPYLQDAQDGYDTIEWIASQPWCNGRVGMIGGSYQGIDQWAAATTCPPHLACLIPQETPVDLYVEMFYRNGVFQLVTFYLWALYVHGPGDHRECQMADVTPQMFRSLPLMEADLAAGHERIPYWREWLQRPRYDEFWELQNYKTAIPKLTVPVLNIGGWFDMYPHSATAAGGLDGLRAGAGGRQGEAPRSGPEGAARHREWRCGADAPGIGGVRHDGGGDPPAPRLRLAGDQAGGGHRDRGEPLGGEGEVKGNAAEFGADRVRLGKRPSSIGGGFLPMEGERVPGRSLPAKAGPCEARQSPGPVRRPAASGNHG